MLTIWNGKNIIIVGSGYTVLYNKEDERLQRVKPLCYPPANVGPGGSGVRAAKA